MEAFKEVPKLLFHGYVFINLMQELVFHTFKSIISLPQRKQVYYLRQVRS